MHSLFWISKYLRFVLILGIQHKYKKNRCLLHANSGIETPIDIRLR